jgi:hypothetical protein
MVRWAAVIRKVREAPILDARPTFLTKQELRNAHRNAARFRIAGF